jgi:hypothetical protein
VTDLVRRVDIHESLQNGISGNLICLQGDHGQVTDNPTLRAFAKKSSVPKGPVIEATGGIVSPKATG